MPTRKKELPGRSTGPKTKDGKAKSSQNARKHGCCAKTLILPDECRDEYERIRTGWMAEFEPEGYPEERLVEILALNDWHLQRAQRRFMEAEAALCTGPDEELGEEDYELWLARREHDLELKLRYKTSLERAFYRAWNALQGLRKDLTKREVTLIRNEGKIRELEAANSESGAGDETENTGLGSGPKTVDRSRAVYARRKGLLHRAARP